MPRGLPRDNQRKKFLPQVLPLLETTFRKLKEVKRKRVELLKLGYKGEQREEGEDMLYYGEHTSMKVGGGNSSKKIFGRNPPKEDHVRG